MTIKRVTDIQRDALNFSNQLILEVRQAMPYGAGNQEQDAQNSRGASIPRTQLAYQTWQAGVRAPRGSAGGFKPRLLAAIAKEYGAGNCDMAGAMAYTLLRERLNDNYDVMLIVNPEGKHTYAAFKQRGADVADSIIVDAWPPYGQATLADDHFQGIKPAWVERMKPGKQGVAATRPVGRTEMPARWYDLRHEIKNALVGIANSDTSALLTAPPQRYDHLVASKDPNLQYVDSANIPVPLPATRLSCMMAPPPAPAGSDQMEIDSAGGGPAAINQAGSAPMDID